MQKPQTLKGFRDFLPEEKRKRDFIIQRIKQVFELFGFEPLETPTLEYAGLLLGKYGDEADKLVYTFTDRGKRQIGLRFDQTVPTARILAQYQNQLPKYFRRYQIQNVFRADKPQKGRFREFTQCDIDIFGSSSPLADAEIVSCTYWAFKNIGFKQVKIKINDRQILFETLKPFTNKTVDVFSLIQSIDKLNKIGAEAVISELENKGLNKNDAQKVLKEIGQAKTSPSLKSIIEAAVGLGVAKTDIQFSPSLARGLDYYTDMIFEVVLPEYTAGSCGGGGRYDKLIAQLGGVDIPAVGIAFGFDRMVEAADQLGLIPEQKSGAQVLVTVFSPEYLTQSLQLASRLRQAGVKTELYPDTNVRLDKQFKYANKKGIPRVAIVGPEEIRANIIAVKNMKTGEQETISLEKTIEKLITNG